MVQENSHLNEYRIISRICDIWRLKNKWTLRVLRSYEIYPIANRSPGKWQIYDSYI